MGGKNHYSNCNCGFCIPRKKGKKKEAQEEPGNIVKKKKETLCEDCNRPVVIRKNKRGGFAKFDPSSSSREHKCHIKDDETPDLFAQKAAS